MKQLEEFGIRIPEILLPKNIDLSTWSVIACDQYTQDMAYWKKAEEIANAMSCKFFSGAHEQTLEIKKTPDKIELANRDWRFADLIKYEGIGILLSIAFFASILLFIVGLTVILS